MLGLVGLPLTAATDMQVYVAAYMIPVPTGMTEYASGRCVFVCACVCFNVCVNAMCYACQSWTKVRESITPCLRACFSLLFVT